MYSSASELCSADLLRRFMQYAAGHETAQHVEPSLNAGTTANLSQAARRCEPQSMDAVDASACIGTALYAGSQFSDIWQHSTSVAGWHQSHRPLSAAAHPASLHWPVSMRPMLSDPGKSLQMAQPTAASCQAHALSDRTNRLHTMEPSEPELDYCTDEDDADAVHVGCDALDSDEFSLRRFSSAGVSSAFTSDAAPTPDMRDLCSLRTLSSQDSAWSTLMPRQRRRKSHRPARAPEAVGPEWYAEQQLCALGALSIPALLPPARRQHQQQQQGPMQLRRPHRRPEQLPSGDALPAGDAAAAACPPAARAVRECEDCGTTQTPLWRQYEDATYCNACGLRRKRADGAYVRTSKPARS